MSDLERRIEDLEDALLAYDALDGETSFANLAWSIGRIRQNRLRMKPDLEQRVSDIERKLDLLFGTPTPFPPDEAEKCSMCGGKGHVPLPWQISGIASGYPDDCPNCKGKGYITTPEPEPMVTRDRNGTEVRVGDEVQRTYPNMDGVNVVGKVVARALKSIVVEVECSAGKYERSWDADESVLWRRKGE